MNRTARGASWERYADEFLRNRGLRTLAVNFRSRFGEIDRVMVHGDTVVFVEVRFRATGSGPRAAETIDVHKQRKLWRTAEYFLLRHPSLQNALARFDVIAIDAGPDDEIAVEWIRDAFRVS